MEGVNPHSDLIARLIRELLCVEIRVEGKETSVAIGKDERGNENI